MHDKGLRERKKARTREAIIDAALELFEQKGFDATTVEDIAAAADVSPRTFFRYFESKADLVMIRNEKDEHEHLADLVAARPASESAIDAIHNVFREELAARLADPKLAREFQVTLGTPTLRNMAREHMEVEQAGLATVLAARMAVAPDDLAAHVLSAAVHAMVWTVIERWIQSGAGLDEFTSMLDGAFALLEPATTPRPAHT